jgi:hypothetical protein
MSPFKPFYDGVPEWKKTVGEWCGGNYQANGVIGFRSLSSFQSADGTPRVGAVVTAWAG